VTLYLRVTTNAGRNTIDGVEQRDDGGVVLRIRVKAVPDKGKANAAVVAVLAKALGVPKSAVAIIAGETARTKTLAIAGNPAQLAAAISALN
jgi:uncharacterized protein (TIGR00251 family)